MAEIHYDCEFFEAGPYAPIRLISIGMVAENGDELYRILGDARTLELAVENPWLRQNVIASLPVTVDPTMALGFAYDTGHPDYGLVRHRIDLADEVYDFIRHHGGDEPELWAWYGAYDHVALCQLWGTMTALPKGMPMFTHDLKQEADRLGNPRLPDLPGAKAHRAIDDALECQYRDRWLIEQGPR